jgi:hypothetical protein
MAVGFRRVKVAAMTREERLAPLTGVAVLVLGLAGLIVLEGPADRPEIDAAPSAFLSYFGDRDTVILGSFLLMLSAAFFIWFAGALRAALRQGEGEAGRLSAIAFGGGVATAILFAALPSVSILGALDADQLSPVDAKTIFLVGDAFIYAATVTAAVLLAATGLTALRAATLPRWLAWVSLALALWLLIPPFGSAGGTPENPAAWTGLAALDAVPLWTAMTAIVLMLAPPGSRPSGKSERGSKTVPGGP